MEHILLITNADAGSADRRSVDAAVTRLQQEATVDVEATTGPQQLRDVLRSRGDRDVVVVGGDGSLHAVVSTLRELGDLGGPTIGLIPLGTGNDFARGASIPLVPAEAAGVVLGGRSGKIDVFVDDDDHIVVNAVHIGVGAEAAIEAKPWKSALGKVKLGKLGYAIGGLVAGFKTQGHRLRVVADDEVLAEGDRYVLQIGLSNGSTVGGGTELAPGASPTDGLADVLVSFSVSPLNRFLYGVRLRRGTHEQRHDVRIARARAIEVSGEEFWVNADGELAGPMTSRSWQVQAAEFTIMLPRR